MESEIERLKKRLMDGIASSDDKFQLAWLEDAIERQKEVAASIRKSANLGERFATRTFETFELKTPSISNAYKTCERYCDEYDDSEQNVLILTGEYGVGKTHLAAAIANRLLDRGIPVLFNTYSGYLEKLKAEFDTGEKAFLKQMKDAPMLIIDDIGKEKVTEWSRSIMFDVINYRYEHMLPSVLTTNLMSNELAKYLGGAVWSRICETAMGVNMVGDDYRKGGR